MTGTSLNSYYTQCSIPSVVNANAVVCSPLHQHRMSLSLCCALFEVSGLVFRSACLSPMHFCSPPTLVQFSEWIWYTKDWVLCVPPPRAFLFSLWKIGPPPEISSSASFDATPSHGRSSCYSSAVVPCSKRRPHAPPDGWLNPPSSSYSHNCCTHFLSCITFQFIHRACSCSLCRPTTLPVEIPTLQGHWPVATTGLYAYPEGVGFSKIGYHASDPLPGTFSSSRSSSSSSSGGGGVGGGGGGGGTKKGGGVCIQKPLKTP